MAATLADLDRQLLEFEDALPSILAEHPDPADHWPEIAGRLDVIEDSAGEHHEHVNRRIDSILGAQGLTLLRQPVN